MIENNRENRVVVSSYDGTKNIEDICNEVREVANAGQKNIKVHLNYCCWSLPYSFYSEVCEKIEKIVGEYSNLKVCITDDGNCFLRAYKSKNWQLSLFKPPKKRR